MKELSADTSARHPRRWATITAIRTRTMLVAVCALGTSLWQGYTIQKHNRLMVQPILDSEINYEANGEWAAFVLNNGLGPAQVTEVIYAVDGKRVESPEAALSALGEPPGCYGIGGLKHFYRVNARQQVFSLRDKQCGKTPEALTQMLKRLRVTLHYESLYGDKATLEVFSNE